MNKKKSKLKRNIIILIIVFAIVGIYIMINNNARTTLSQYAKSAIVEGVANIDNIEVKTTGNGVIEPNKRYEIYSMYPGEIKRVYVEQDEKVDKNDDLFKIGNYYVETPVAGTVITVNNEVGDYIQTNSNMNQKPLAVVADMSKVKFILEIDELDINKVSLGMEVKVSSDAVQDKEYLGKVSKISSEGKSLNGVTTYEVTVVIEEYEGLKIGMNVDATLTLDKKDSTLIIPMAAINKIGDETYVYVKDEAYTGDEPVFYTTPSSMANIAGYKKKTVTVGINNKDYIEITSGLENGNKVYYISSSKTITEYMLEQAGSSGGMQITMGE